MGERRVGVARRFQGKQKDGMCSQMVCALGWNREVLAQSSPVLLEVYRHMLPCHSPSEAVEAVFGLVGDQAAGCWEYRGSRVLEALISL